MVLGAAVDPTKIQPVVARPADFDDFWKSKIALLDEVPMNAVVTAKESGVADVNYATIRLDNIGGAHVYGADGVAEARREVSRRSIIFQWASAPYPLQQPVGHRPRGGRMARGEHRAARCAERHAAGVL